MINVLNAFPSELQPFYNVPSIEKSDLQQICRQEVYHRYSFLTVSSSE